MCKLFPIESKLSSVGNFRDISFVPSTITESTYVINFKVNYLKYLDGIQMYTLLLLRNFHSITNIITIDNTGF